MRGTFQVEPWSSSGGTWFMLPLSIDLRYSTDNLKAMFPASSWFCILKSDSNSTVSNSSNYRDYHRLQVEVVQILTPNYSINCTLIPLIAWILAGWIFVCPWRNLGHPALGHLYLVWCRPSEGHYSVLIPFSKSTVTCQITKPATDSWLKLYQLKMKYGYALIFKLKSKLKNSHVLIWYRSNLLRCSKHFSIYNQNLRPHFFLFKWQIG